MRGMARGLGIIYPPHTRIMWFFLFYEFYIKEGGALTTKPIHQTYDGRYGLYIIKFLKRGCVFISNDDMAKSLLKIPLL